MNTRLQEAYRFHHKYSACVAGQLVWTGKSAHIARALGYTTLPPADVYHTPDASWDIIVPRV